MRLRLLEKHYKLAVDRALLSEEKFLNITFLKICFLQRQQEKSVLEIKLEDVLILPT